MPFLQFASPQNKPTAHPRNSGEIASVFPSVKVFSINKCMNFIQICTTFLITITLRITIPQLQKALYKEKQVSHQKKHISGLIFTATGM